LYCSNERITNETMNGVYVELKKLNNISMFVAKKILFDILFSMKGNV